MKLAIQVPIKGKSSQRVPNKNFRDLNGKPLCHWLSDELVQLPEEIDIYIDSEEEDVFESLTISSYSRFHHHKRDAWFAEDYANGNHLLHQFALKHPEYDAYAQLFVTAVTLRHSVIHNAISSFDAHLDEYDSLFLVTEETGWVWHGGKPLNYDSSRPNGLPRSQDATYLKETTGMYLITRKALLLTGCRIGEKPFPYVVGPEYALDIDTMSDLKEAERLLKDQTDT